MAEAVEEHNKAVVRQFLAELEAGNVDGAIALFTPDGTFWSPSQRKANRMPEFAEALHWVNSVLEAPMRYEIAAMTAEDNRVAVLAESWATLKNGTPYNNLYHFYFEVEDGRITRGREYCDTAHIWQTLRAASTQ